MKKYAILLTSIVVMMFALTACDNNDDTAASPTEQPYEAADGANEASQQDGNQRQADTSFTDFTDINDFWAHFHQAVISQDFETLAAMTNFPLRSMGMRYTDPVIYIGLNEFESAFAAFLAEERLITHISEDGEITDFIRTNYEFIAQHEYLTFLGFDEHGALHVNDRQDSGVIDGDWARAYDKIFEIVDGVWRLTGFFSLDMAEPNVYASNPFAAALLEYFDDGADMSAFEATDSTMAFMVTVDGSPGVIAIRYAEPYLHLPEARVFVFTGLEVIYKDIGIVAGFPFSIGITPDGRPVKVTGDAGDLSYTLFGGATCLETHNDVIVYTFTLYAELVDFQNYAHNHYQFRGGFEDGIADGRESISEDEFNEIRQRYGLDNFRVWFEVEDETERILAMTFTGGGIVYPDINLSNVVAAQDTDFTYNHADFAIHIASARDDLLAAFGYLHEFDFYEGYDFYQRHGREEGDSIVIWADVPLSSVWVMTISPDFHADGVIYELDSTHFMAESLLPGQALVIRNYMGLGSFPWSGITFFAEGSYRQHYFAKMHNHTDSPNFFAIWPVEVRID